MHLEIMKKILFCLLFLCNITYINTMHPKKSFKNALPSHNAQNSLKQDEEEHLKIELLPNELIHLILQHCSFNEIKHVILISKKYYDIVKTFSNSYNCKSDILSPWLKKNIKKLRREKRNTFQKVPFWNKKQIESTIKDSQIKFSKKTECFTDLINPTIINMLKTPAKTVDYLIRHCLKNTNINNQIYTYTQEENEKISRDVVDKFFSYNNSKGKVNIKKIIEFSQGNNNPQCAIHMELIYPDKHTKNVLYIHTDSTENIKKIKDEFLIDTDFNSPITLIIKTQHTHDIFEMIKQKNGLNVIKEIYARNSTINEDACNFLTEFQNIESISFRACHIKTVPNVSLCSDLKKINLNDNSIKTIEPEKLPLNLRILKLNNNPIEDINQLTTTLKDKNGQLEIFFTQQIQTQTAFNNRNIISFR